MGRAGAAAAYGIAGIAAVVFGVVACGSSSSDDLRSGGGTGGKAGAGASGASGGAAGTSVDGSGATGGAGGAAGSLDASLDSADIEDGEAGLDDGSGDDALAPTPGKVQCRQETCDLGTIPPSICCLHTQSLFPTMCSPAFPGCVTAAKAMSCDDRSDCMGGDVCCAERSSTGVYLFASCAPSCQGGSIVLCRQPADCGAGQSCRPIPDLPGFFGCG